MSLGLSHSKLCQHTSMQMHPFLLNIFASTTLSSSVLTFALKSDSEVKGAAPSQNLDYIFQRNDSQPAQKTKTKTHQQSNYREDRRMKSCNPLIPGTSSQGFNPSIWFDGHDRPKNRYLERRLADR